MDAILSGVHAVIDFGIRSIGPSGSATGVLVVIKSSTSRCSDEHSALY
jgi:hypothetical protein